MAMLVLSGSFVTGGVAAASVALSVPRRAAALGPPTQPLTALLAAHEAYAQPGASAQPLELVAARRPLTGERTVLPVLATWTSARSARWLDVMLPGRPNGRTGWISGTATRAMNTTFAIVVDTTTRELTVYQHGRPVRTASVVVGKPSTPTPIGRFFVEEVVQLAPKAVGAPYAFALSARSNVLQEFDGGPGQIALHGLENVGGTPGTAVSHGCVRLTNATLAWMVTRIGPGVLVTITR